MLLILLIVSVDTVQAQAQERRYRVEILVLTHLEHYEEPLDRMELPDFSLATDFLTPPAEEEEEAAAEEVLDDVNVVEQLIPGEVASAEDEGAEPEEDPNRLVHVEEMSSVMQETWRRLRLSGPFRPEQYLSWEQGNQEPFPSLRVHDLKTVMVDDPWAEFRIGLDGTQTVFTDVTGSNSPEAGEEMDGPALPDPVYYYRLDGAISLKRSRFLHLDMDIQLREAVWDPERLVAPVTQSADDLPVQPSSFLVHELKQSRQVRSGRMEYFDGPVLGVLAWITEVKEESGESP